MAREISNYDDIIDSREIIERIAEIEADGDRTEDDDQELATLRALAEEGESMADWQYGATLIRDSYFVQYAQELADDLGIINSNATAGQWPLYHIDWEAAADELKQDYTEIDFDGVTYWVR